MLARPASERLLGIYWLTPVTAPQVQGALTGGNGDVLAKQLDHLFELGLQEAQAPKLACYEIQRRVSCQPGTHLVDRWTGRLGRREPVYVRCICILGGA